MGFLWASIRRKFNMCRMIPINSQTYRTSSSIEIAMVILSLATTDSFQIVRIQRFVTFCDQLRSAGRHVVFIFIDLLCLLHAPFALYCTSTLHCFSIKFWFVLLLKWVASIDDDEHVLLAARSWIHCFVDSLLYWMWQRRRPRRRHHRRWWCCCCWSQQYFTTSVGNMLLIACVI